jgi:hypothetical protein
LSPSALTFFPLFQISGCAPSSAGELADEWQWDEIFDGKKDEDVKKRWLKALAEFSKQEEPRLEVTVVGTSRPPSLPVSCLRTFHDVQDLSSRRRVSLPRRK